MDTSVSTNTTLTIPQTKCEPLKSSSLQQLQQFRNDIVAADSSPGMVDQAIKETIDNTKWVAENKELVKKWLKEEMA